MRKTILIAVALGMLSLGAAAIADAQCCAARSAQATSARSGLMMMTLVKSGSIARLEAYLATPGVSINDRSDNDKALLDFAAEQNQVVIARYLLGHGADVNARQTNVLALGVTALDRAAYFGSVDVARLLISHGAYVNPTGVGAPPLLFAASGGRIDMVELLLAHGADLAYRSAAGQTPISAAAAAGHMDVVRLLQARGAAPDTRALMDAAAHGEVATVRYLLTQSPRQDTVDLALRFAVIMDNGRPEDQEQIVSMLLTHGADANNHANHAPNTPVMLATSPAVVALLIAHGADVNEVTPWGTPVEALACNGSIKNPIAIFQVLLAHGAHLKAAVPRGRSALDCAIALDRPDFAEFLLDHGMPVDMRDGSGRTPLFSAIDPAMIKLLVTHGANINAVDGRGLTPLTSALTEQRDSLALSLLAAGADAKGVPGTGDAPLIVAAGNGATQVVRDLLERGADPNVKSQRGESVLEDAVAAGNLPIAHLLIAHGADLNQRGPMGWTALHYAASHNNAALVSLLLENGANRSLVNNYQLPAEALATSLDVRGLFENRAEAAVTSSAGQDDAAACEEVVRRYHKDKLSRIIEPGAAPNAPEDPADDWDYLGQIAQPKPVMLQGRPYVLGMATAPAYLARVRSDGVESVICEYETDFTVPSGIRVMTMLERLKARSTRDFQSVSLESLKVVGLLGAQALLEASRRTRDPVPLADDSDANVLGDALMAHRDDVLAFYLDHGIDPNLPWGPHAAIDGVHSAPWHDAPLYTAVRYGSPESVLMLLDHGANPNSAGGGSGMLHESDLSWAIRNGAVESVRTLLDHGADPTAASTFYTVTSTLQDISRQSPRENRLVAATRLLLLHGGDPDAWIWVAFQTVARDRGRNDLLTLALSSRLRSVRSEWIQSLLGTGGNADPAITALLGEAAAIRDSSGCPAQASSDALAQCLPNALRSADEALNARYLIGSSGPGGPRLRAAERAWLRGRDTRCGAREIPGLTEGGWLSYVLSDQNRAVCVLDLTRQRLSAWTAAGLGAPSPGRTSPAAGSEIQSAIYASPRNGQSIDVTDELRSLCERTPGPCIISCGNQLAGDPDFGQRKYCRITYRCDREATEELQIQEGETRMLACSASSTREVLAPPAVSSASTAPGNQASMSGESGPASARIEQHGRVTSVTIPGQLAATQTLGCVDFEKVRSTATPPDLYDAGRACVDQGNYDDAAQLFILAGAYGRFDAARVADKTAGQGLTILIMSFGSGLREDQKQPFMAAIKRLQSVEGRERLCRQFTRLGPPDYFPRYMILHGIRAFTTADPTTNALDRNFDAATTWQRILTEGLSCTAARY